MDCDRRCFVSGLFLEFRLRMFCRFQQRRHSGKLVVDGRTWMVDAARHAVLAINYQLLGPPPRSDGGSTINCSGWPRGRRYRLWTLDFGPWTIFPDFSQPGRDVATVAPRQASETEVQDPVQFVEWHAHIERRARRRQPIALR